MPSARGDSRRITPMCSSWASESRVGLPGLSPSTNPDNPSALKRSTQYSTVRVPSPRNLEIAQPSARSFLVLPIEHRATCAPGANYLPTLRDALAGRTVLQADQAASANQALLRKLDERSQDSDLDRGVRLRAGGDLEEGASTTAKFTQHFTNFKREHF